MAASLADGSIKRKFHIVEGLEKAPESLPLLFSGLNSGKLWAPINYFTMLPPPPLHFLPRLNIVLTIFFNRIIKVADEKHETKLWLFAGVCTTDLSTVYVGATFSRIPLVSADTILRDLHFYPNPRPTKDSVTPRSMSNSSFLPWLIQAQDIEYGITFSQDSHKFFCRPMKSVRLENETR